MKFECRIDFVTVSLANPFRHHSIKCRKLNEINQTDVSLIWLNLFRQVHQTTFYYQLAASGIKLILNSIPILNSGNEFQFGLINGNQSNFN